MPIAIRHAVLIYARRSEVWRAIASAEGWNGWFTSECTLEPWPGGAFRPVWHQWGPDRVDIADEGRVLEIRAPDRIAFEWQPEGVTTRFAMTLARDGEDTRLELVDEGHADETEEDRARSMRCACAWGEALMLLKHYVEYDVGYVPRDD
jgi:uncharacterized protein YndB with AHSA1/START domain